MSGRLALVVASQCNAVKTLPFLPSTKGPIDTDAIQTEQQLGQKVHRLLTSAGLGECDPVDVDGQSLPGLLLNPTAREARKALAKAMRRADEAEAVLLIYFLGHGGLQDSGGSPRHALYLWDSHPEAAGPHPGRRSLFLRLRKRVVRGPSAIESLWDPYEQIRVLRQEHPRVAGLLLLVDACQASSARDVANSWGSAQGGLDSVFLGSSDSGPAFDGCFTRVLVEQFGRGVSRYEHPSDEFKVLLNAVDLAQIVSRDCKHQKPTPAGYNWTNVALWIAMNPSHAEFAEDLGLDGSTAKLISDRTANRVEFATEAARTLIAEARLACIVGPAGSGKTSLAASLRSEGAVDAAVFASTCRSESELADTLRGQLDRLPGFGHSVKAFQEGLRGMPQPLSPFHRLVAGPLAHHKPDVCLVVDGLDQMARDPSFTGVLRGLRRLAKGPDKVRLLLLGREPVTIPGFRVVSMPTLTNNVAVQYLESRGITGENASKLAALAGPSWLVLSLGADLAHRDGKVGAASLDDVYRDLLHPLRVDEGPAADDLLAILATAGPGPILPFSVLQSVMTAMGHTATRSRVLDILGHPSLYRVLDRQRPGLDDERLGLFHLSLVDYLQHGAAFEATHSAMLDYCRRWQQDKSGYAIRRLTSLLAGSGLHEEVGAVLGDPRWIRAKLVAVGLPEVLSDFAFAEPGSPAGQIGEALRLSAVPLAGSPNELASQLLGRLGDRLDPAFADTLARDTEGAWLRPLTVSLAPPVGPFQGFLRIPEELAGEVISATPLVALSGDGRKAVGWGFPSSAPSASGEAALDSVQLLVWDTRSLAKPVSISPPIWPSLFALSDDGSQVVLAGPPEEGERKPLLSADDPWCSFAVVDTRTGQVLDSAPIPLFLKPTNGGILPDYTCLAMAPGGAVVVLGDTLGRIIVWRRGGVVSWAFATPANKDGRHFADEVSQVMCPDERVVIAVLNSGRITRVETTAGPAQGPELLVGNAEADDSATGCLSPDGSALLWGGDSGEIHALPLNRGGSTLPHVPPKQPTGITEIFAVSATSAACRLRSGTLRTWDLDSGRIRGELSHAGYTTDLVAGGGGHALLRLNPWRLALLDLTQLPEPTAGTSPDEKGLGADRVTCCTVAPDGRTAYFGSSLGHVLRVDVPPDGHPQPPELLLRAVPCRGKDAGRVSFTGRWNGVVPTRDALAKVNDPDEHPARRPSWESTFPEDSGVGRICVSETARYIAFTLGACTYAVWDSQGATEPSCATFRTNARVPRVDDEGTVFAGNSIGEWASDEVHVRQGSLWRSYPGGLDTLAESAGFHFDRLDRSVLGTTVALGAGRRRDHAGGWIVARSAAHTSTVRAHDQRVALLAVDDQGQRMLSVGSGGDIAFWRWSGSDLQRIHSGSPRLTGEPAIASFSPDGRHVVVGSETGEVFVYSSENGEHLTTFHCDFPVADADIACDGTLIAVVDALGSKHLLRLEHPAAQQPARDPQ